MPLPCAKPAEGDERTPAVWGLYQASLSGLFYMRQALDGLSFLHSSGFTHGLFGPLAIFVTTQGDYRQPDVSFELLPTGLAASNSARRAWIQVPRSMSATSCKALPLPPAGGLGQASLGGPSLQPRCKRVASLP